jgi:hypothetical protein
LRTVGTLAASTAAVSGVTAATHPDQQPDHVTISYDQSRLADQRARLDMAAEDEGLLVDQYGWVAESTEFDTDALVYWCQYRQQEGSTPFDSHVGDHEPYYVFVDSDTGAFRELVGSVYHWTRGRTTDPLTDTEDHPTLRVVNPYHHYTATDASGRLFDVEDLTGEFEAWLSNGLEEDLEPGLVYNPWRMKGASGRSHWWRDELDDLDLPVIGEVSLNVSLTAAWVRVNRTLGRFGEVGSL